MNFFKEHAVLRLSLMFIFSIFGFVLLIFGFKMTAELTGLFIMLGGIVSLLAALYVYNKAFEQESERTK